MGGLPPAVQPPPCQEAVVVDRERPVFTSPHIPSLLPHRAQQEAWRLLSQERPPSARHPLGCLQDPELKGQRWKVTQWCPHCRAAPPQYTSEQVWPPCFKQTGKGFPGGSLGRNKLGIGRTQDWADGTISQGSGGRLCLKLRSPNLHVRVRPLDPITLEWAEPARSLIVREEQILE